MSEMQNAVALAMCAHLHKQGEAPSCVMVVHPDREPCTSENCQRMQMAEAVIALIEPAVLRKVGDELERLSGKMKTREAMEQLYGYAYACRVRANVAAEKAARP